MTRDAISVQYPTSEDSQSICSGTVTKTTVTAANGVTIKNAFANKNNTLMICIENTSDSDSDVTFKAGDCYPNSMLGDLDVSVLTKSITVCQIQDISRFENKDGSLNLDFETAFTGNIFAIAKPVDLNV